MKFQTLVSLNDTKEFNTEKELGKLRCRITGKPPLADLYTFEGQLKTSDSREEPKPLGPDNLLLRGARLKNTEYVYGKIYLYTVKPLFFHGVFFSRFC